MLIPGTLPKMSLVNQAQSNIIGLMTFFSLVEMVKIDAEVEIGNIDFTNYTDNVPNWDAVQADPEKIEYVTNAGQGGSHMRTKCQYRNNSEISPADEVLDQSKT